MQTDVIVKSSLTMCQLCEKNFKVITNTHLVKSHSSSIIEYKKRFVNSSVGFTVNPSTLPKSDERYKKWLISLKGRKSWNKGKTKATDERVKKISETFKIKEIDNFAAWRQKAKEAGMIGNYISLEQSIELAFLIGLILGDGYIGKTSRTEVLRIALGADKPLLWKYAYRVVKQIFNKEPHVHKGKHSKCIYITIYQQGLSERLEIPLGPKKNYILSIPEWIQNDQKYLLSALKGLFEAEGSFSIHVKTYTYNFSFSNLNVGLLNFVEEALLRFGFHPERRHNAVRIRRKHEALAFEEIISFRKYPLI